MGITPLAPQGSEETLPLGNCRENRGIRCIESALVPPNCPLLGDATGDAVGSPIVPLRAHSNALALHADEPCRERLELVSHPGAVAIVCGNGVEVWLAPAQADALAEDLKRLAAEARRG